MSPTKLTSVAPRDARMHNDAREYILSTISRSQRRWHGPEAKPPREGAMAET